MKKILLAMALCVAHFSNAQTLSYTDIGELFSKETINGTARFNAMSGAFGALGGDLSAIETNPAGAAVYNLSEFSTSLSVKNLKTNALFYGINQFNENDKLDLSQAGGIMVFKTGSDTNWRKLALSFNYQIINDFENLWIAKGNSGFAPITDEYDPDVVYKNSDGHYFENLTEGNNKKYTFTLASEYNENLLVGFSLSTYNVEYYQKVLSEEYNNDGAGNTFDVSQNQELITYGDGISLNLGLISKPTKEIRLGIAYQTPVWYALKEEFTDFDVEINESINNSFTTDFSGTNGFDYRLKTPAKLTGSVAYIFEKSGLISLDYIYKDYSSTRLSKSNFTNENNTFQSDLEGSTELRLGTEWRFGSLSVRGGYHYEKNPFKYAFETDDIEGFSLGAGFKFRGGKIDFSYQKSSNTAPYNFYPNNNQVNAAELDFETSKVTATLVLHI